MFEWLTHTWDAWGMTWWKVLFAVLISAVTFAVSTAAVTFVLVKLPANYFHSSHERAFLTSRHPLLRMCGIFLKNLLGLLLVGFGVLMTLPGVPGPGVLTILFGVMLLDFPRKRELEVKFVSRPRVFQAINALRARFSRPPLLLD
jgi:hypothetical protein